MRKITSFLMLFCAFVCSAWAGPTDLPEVSTEGNIKWYTIKNVRTSKYATYAGDNATMTQQANGSAAALFYFTASGTEGAVKIHNYVAGDKLCAAYNSWTTDGIDWYLKKQSTGVSICTSADEWNAWNDASGAGQKVEYWSASDAGSAWEIALVTDFSSVINVPAAKEAAKAEIQNYAVVSSIYPATTSFVDAINAVTPADNSIAGLNAAVEAINAQVVEYRKSAYAALGGKYFSIQTPGRTKGFMEMATSKVVGAESLATPAGIWQFVSNNDGTLKVFNPYTGKYLCEPQASSAEVAVTTDANSAGNYTLEVNDKAEVADAKIKLTSNVKSVHMAGGFTLVRWDNGGASEWQLKEVSDFSNLIATHKTNTIATLEQWATLSVVFDASLIATAKENVEAVNTNTWETFAAIDAKLSDVTDAVAAKMFTFQTIATDAGRNGVWVSANASTGKAIGADNQDYNAIWSLRHAGGVSFFIYNELTAKYMGKPSGNATLTDAPVDAYTFEIIDAANSVVEFKCGGETLHASNTNDDKLMNYDADEAASRWYIRTIDIAADIQTILDGLTAEDYAETPALGQYPTAAYEALVAARTNAKTVEEVDAAIAAFKKSQNVPVYFITSMHDGYAKGSAIMYNGTKWRWAKANMYDRQMWMTIPGYTKADVPVVDDCTEDGTFYELCDYPTRTLMRGKKVQIVKVADWEGAYNLQYSANDESTDAAHHAKDTGDLVNWKPGTKDNAQASVWHVEYIGSSYELEKLTDEKIQAFAALKTAYDAKAYYKNAVMGSGIGQFNGNKDAIVAELAKAEAVYAKTLVEQANMSIEEINAIAKSITDVAGLTLNMPETGFYRIKSLNGNDVNKAGKYWQIGVGESGYTAMEAGTDLAKSIVYIKSNGETYNIVNYVSGLYLNNYAALDPAGTAAESWTIVENNAVMGAYALYAGTDTDCLSDWLGITNGKKDANAVWAIEAVGNLPVAVTSAGYATLYAPVALTLADGLKAYYTAEVTENAVKLAAIEGGVIPANTGVILTGDANTYDLTIATGAEPIEGNLFVGNVAATLVNDDAYVLAKPQDMDICFYKATKNFKFAEDGTFTKVDEGGTHFLNNGFKAYLPASVVPSAARFLSFDFGNETAIENIEGAENGANAVIYDLSGRRVQKVQKGLYIVNGVKVIK